MEEKEQKQIEDMTREELIEALKNAIQDRDSYNSLYQMYKTESETYKDRISALRIILKTM